MDINSNFNGEFNQNVIIDEEAERESRRKLRQRFIAGILTGTLIATFVLMGLFVFARPSMGLSSGGAVLQNAQGINGDNELLNATTVNKIHSLEDVIDDYFYQTDVDKLKEADGIYKGLMESLDDPYSVYYTEDELEDLLNDTAGIYYGIGAYVSIDEDMNMPRVSGVIPGTPAERAELQTDDIISLVDGESTSGMALEDVVSKIKGPEGTKVTITLLRGSKREEVVVEVERSAVEVPTVTTKFMGDNEEIGYLQISEFDEITTQQFIDGMAELRAKNIKGLILDLRSNPGGSLQAVCDIARQLLPKGNIVYTIDRDGNRDDYTCDGENEIDIPVVVLVNQYSASASEILSGALKDYGIAKLVGKKTYGKGIVQRIFDLKDGTAVKLTVSTYYTPNGTNIHGIGIEPDVEVEYDPDAYAKDKTDTQLDKAVEVMKDMLDN